MNSDGLYIFLRVVQKRQLPFGSQDWITNQLTHFYIPQQQKTKHCYQSN